MTTRGCRHHRLIPFMYDVLRPKIQYGVTNTPVWNTRGGHAPIAPIASHRATPRTGARRARDDASTVASARARGGRRGVIRSRRGGFLEFIIITQRHHHHRSSSRTTVSTARVNDRARVGVDDGARAGVER